MSDTRLLDQMIGNLVLLSEEDLKTLRRQVIKEEIYRQMPKLTRGEVSDFKVNPPTHPVSEHEVNRGAW